MVSLGFQVYLQISCTRSSICTVLQVYIVTAKIESMRVSIKFKWQFNKNEWSKLKTSKIKNVECKVIYKSMMSKRWIQLQQTK